MRWLVALAVCLALLGCATNQGSASPGARQLTFNFRNDSSQEMHILVTRNSDNAVVGSTTPAAIPAGAHIQVALTVPDGDEWALFLEPLGSDIGPLMFGSDFHGCSGAVALEIAVAPDGNVGRSSTGPFC